MMRTKFQLTQLYLSSKWIGALFLLFGLMSIPLISYAAKEPPQQTPTSATGLSGQLPRGYSAHYLTVEPTQRDGTVTLHLAIDPNLNLRAASLVNLWVLSPEGVRKFKAGEKPNQIAIATGNPTGLDETADAKAIHNKTATFKTSGRERYTIIVYNRATIPVNYTLTVDHGLLLDPSGQTKAGSAAAQAQATAKATEPPKLAATSTAQPSPTVTPAPQVSATATNKPAAPSAPQATNTPTAQPKSDEEGGDEGGNDE